MKSTVWQWLLSAALSLTCGVVTSTTELDHVVLSAVAHKTSALETAFAPNGPGWIEKKRSFTSLNGTRLRMELGAPVHWLRLQFDNASANTALRCLDLGMPSHAEVKVFVDDITQTGNFTWREMTDVSSAALTKERSDFVCDTPSPRRIWPLELKGGERRTVIVRVEAPHAFKMNLRTMLPMEARANTQRAMDVSLIAATATGAATLAMLLLAFLGNKTLNAMLAANGVAALAWISTVDTTMAARAPMSLMQFVEPYGAMVSAALFAVTYLLSYSRLLVGEPQSVAVERAGMLLIAAVPLGFLLVFTVDASAVTWVQWLLIGVMPYLTVAYSWSAWKSHEPASTWMLGVHTSLLIFYAWQLHDLLIADTLASLPTEVHLIWLAGLLLHNLARSCQHQPGLNGKDSKTSVAKLEAEVERRTEDLRIAREMAERTGALQRDFLATMSHELRTPLASVVGLCRMLGDDATLPDRVRQDMGTVERLAVHLLRMVDDGLAFVRQRGEEEPVMRKPVNMRILLRDMESVSRWLSQRQSNEFKMLQVRDVPPVLYFDEQRLRQVLINLVSNAGLYCQNGQISLGVAFRVTQGETKLSWLISDSGRGMSSEELKNSFEPFVKSRDSQGLGLGLALVKKLTEEMGGSIRVQSQLGLGTQFYVTLPVSTGGEPVEEFPLEEDVGSLQRDVKVSRPMALLPELDLSQLQLDDLRMYARLGQLSEIEAWIRETEGVTGLSAEADRFLRKVRQAAAAVDLTTINTLIDQIDTPLDKG